MVDENILIIGAGASGLMAARELAREGRRVTVLEAKEKTGGRILDIPASGSTIPFMLGAEFIHGNAELTFELLKEAGIEFSNISGKSYFSRDGKLEDYGSDQEFWPEFNEKLDLLTEDITLTEFLDRYFKEEQHKELRESVIRFAEGYDAADANRVSVLSLKKEWEQDDQEHQYRVEGGYSKLIEHLENECLDAGVVIVTGKVVSHFNWSRGFVEAITIDGERYAARKVIITIPLGVLQIKDGSAGAVNFTPPLPIRMGAVRAMGFGSVIKVVLEFDQCFWPEDAGFIFSNEIIPVWWTQNPSPSKVLTGWLAGPSVEKLKDKPESELIEIALDALSKIFELDSKLLGAGLKHAHACNWTNNPFSRGAYTYTTVEEPNAAAVLGNAVQETLYFAGEGIYHGPQIGTVEAALMSGREAARRVLSGY
ncbi:flavin monoamine oxidase family protein [Desertivirga arenae]|uniref:flavin monoamine oxidase family protein n=1 Tax=Desertivirga arenae TaxID=2810309 RepID=UPI001A963820|nr:NAD(P)/FAD-dependent oxidoreductase [Pedobacter sp. SYSU D00823]